MKSICVLLILVVASYSCFFGVRWAAGASLTNKQDTLEVQSSNFGTWYPVRTRQGAIVAVGPYVLPAVVKLPKWYTPVGNKALLQRSRRGFSMKFFCASRLHRRFFEWAKACPNDFPIQGHFHLRTSEPISASVANYYRRKALLIICKASDRSRDVTVVWFSAPTFSFSSVAKYGQYAHDMLRVYRAGPPLICRERGLSYLSVSYSNTR